MLCQKKKNEEKDVETWWDEIDEMNMFDAHLMARRELSVSRSFFLTNVAF